MMLRERAAGHPQKRFAVGLIALMLLGLTAPLVGPGNTALTLAPSTRHVDTEPWNGTEQPWGQYGRTPDRDFQLPAHDPDGGPGTGDVANVSELASITTPVINWQAFESGDGADGYGSVIGDFSSSITATPAARERCGAGTLQAVLITSEPTDTGRSSSLNIVSGDDAKLAWKVDLGTTDAIRATPMIHDIDQDGRPEIVVAYDTDGNFNVDVWSPRLTCTESNWQVSGHTNELLWSYTDSDVRLGSPSPHFASSNSGHDAVTQPVLADLELDGTPELVVAVVDDPNNDPTPKVLAFELTTTAPTDAMWSVTLDRGTHPSDPTWVQLDGSTTAVVLTTVDANSGNMWVWKIDGDSGSLDWDRLAIQGTDSDSDAPRLRLPGPVIAQLDTDAAPEMVLTVPTDANNRDAGSGARFIGMELTSTTEVFNFRAQNGYADAPPAPVDTDSDGVDDRLCWVTWYSESAFNFNRKGMLGCTDISDDNPTVEWTRDLQRGSGNDNDEIAVSPPVIMNIDGEGAPDVVVAFGRRVWAFDGNTGASADINDDWSTPLSMPHRVWTAPALADVDGDGHLDMLYGDTLISNAGSDFSPALDGRGLSFNPVQADPGQTVTVTGQLVNMGTLEADDDLDAAILMNGQEIARERFTNTDPVAPSGEGGPLTFSVDITATLGVHQFELVVDVNSNITEMREDNNRFSTDYTVVEPYVGQLSGPQDTTRIVPGTSQTVTVVMEATGSRTADWQLSFVSTGLPEGWTFQSVEPIGDPFTLAPSVPQSIDFLATVPASALGGDAGVVTLNLALTTDTSINTTLQIPLEVFRTRGLDIVGPEGINASTGQGRPGGPATAWFMVENLGNAEEQTTSISWTAPSWGGSPSIQDAEGQTLFSVTLAPGEQRELGAVLDVPAGTAFGATSDSTMTMCMGSGEDALCEELLVVFQAVALAASPTHTRTLPDRTVSYELTTSLPADGTLSINMAEAGMLQPNWAWSTTGDWTINGSLLEADGAAGAVVTGTLLATVHENAVPYRHAFTAEDPDSSEHALNLTMQVLQIHRANLSVLEPLPNEEGIVTLNVSEPHRFLFFLENPGNGEDRFELRAEITQHDPTFQPNLSFTFFDPIKTLGPLATSIGSVDVSLDADTPALSPIDVRFHWTSLDGVGVSQHVDMTLQASPRYAWQVNLNNTTVPDLVPGETMVLSFNVTNVGNAASRLTLASTWTVQRQGSDASVWAIQDTIGPLMDVNQTEFLHVNIAVPPSAWAGTSLELVLTQQSGGFNLSTTSLSLTVAETLGWALDLSETDLEIDPFGENITVGLIHLGNGVEQPYFAKAGAGWNMTLPANATPLGPFERANFTVYVQPPEDALAGDIGTLHLRVTGDDRSGEIEEHIPLRVGQSPRIEVEHRGTWLINDQGGYPTAWVENQGNDMALLQVDVDGLPEGWSVDQGVQMVLAPGEIMGLPLDLVPDANWNGQRLLLTINVHHPVLGVTAHDIEVESSLVSFQTTPVRDAFIGTVHTVPLHAPNITLSNVAADGVTVTVDNGALTFTQPTNGGELELTFTTSAGNQTASLYVQARTYPDATADCSFNTDAFANLGRAPLDDAIATCTLEADDATDLQAYLSIVSSSGEALPLGDDDLRVLRGSEARLNLTANGWSPSPGEHVLVLRVHDQFGRLLDDVTITTVARATGWNIGVNSIQSEGDITVGIQRTGYSILADTVCVLVVEADGGWSSSYVVDIAYAAFAPVISIEEPAGVEKDERITATIGCDAPFDVDDDPSDNTASTYHKPSSALAVSSSDVAFIAGTAVIIVVVAWVAGVVRPRPARGKRQTIEQVEEQPPAPSAKTPEPLPSTSSEEDDDDISIVLDDDHDHMDDDRTTEVDVHDEPVPQTSEQDAAALVEHIPVVDTTPSGRLASLREEMGADGQDSEPTESIEDRMSRFFGDEG